MKRFIVAGVLLLALSPIAAPAKDLDAAPSGLTPATTTLSAILKSYDKAVGRRALSVRDTTKETWTFDRAGLSGTETLVRSGRDYHATLVSGPLVEEYGQLLDHRWHRDFNGVVSTTTTDDIESFVMLLFTQPMYDAADPKNDVKVLGVTAGDKPAYLVSISKTGEKHPEFVAYDKTTGLVQSASFVYGDRRSTITYGDYRATKGLTQPWHVHYTDGTSVLDYDFQRTALTLGAPVSFTEFGIPNTRTKFASYAGDQKLPAKFLTDRFPMDIGHGYTMDVTTPTIVVRLMVNGRGLDFSLSSGQPQTIIDADVARQLQLPTFGQATRADGEDVGYETVIPSATIGGLTLTNLAVLATPFNYDARDTMKVVGVIGSDVLSSGVFRIDYDNGVLQLTPAQNFAPSSLGGTGWSTMPITFDSHYPFINGSLDSNPTQNILFSNDFFLSMLFGSFIDEHPASAPDMISGKHAVAQIPFADAHGYGRNVSIFLSKIKDVQLGPIHFANFPIIAVDDDFDFGGRTTDAVLGGDLLRLYDVVLDYPHNRIFMKPNRSFYDRFSVKK